MRAEILAVGTELLLGEIADTNSSFLASQLPALGIDLYWISLVGDNPARLCEVLKRAWQRSDIILVTGGLGPTEGDITRECIAEILDERIQIIPQLEQELRGFFTRRGTVMSPSNLKQATLIPSAKAIPNPNGTAPGWWIEKDGRILAAMPGPPRELQPMWQEHIAPRLLQIAGGDILVSRVIKTAGLGESILAERVSHLFSSANPTMGIYAKPDGIHIRLAAKAKSKEQAQAMIAEVEAKVKSLLADYVWGADEDTLEGVIGRMFIERGWSLAVMEGYTGGLLTNAFIEVPGAESFFKGGLIACADVALAAFGVDSNAVGRYGVASQEVVEAMAKAVRPRFKATIGLGLSGADEPKDSSKKPFRAIYVALDDGKTVTGLTDYFPGTRAQVKRRAMLTALLELKKLLAKSI